MPERAVSNARRDRLSVEEALERILAVVDVLPPETVHLLEAVDRVLAESVVADRDIPPVTNSAMDGYAVRSVDLAAADDGPLQRLTVVGEAAAGHMSGQGVGAGEAVRIMTGAPLPAGADTVVRFEDVRVMADGGEIEIVRIPRPGRNVRLAGEDVRAGQIVLQPGKLLRPQEIGMLAALGHTEVSVIGRPTVAVLATGDEIVPPMDEPGPGQIRDANSYTVAAQVQRCGGVPLLLGVARDEEELVRSGIRQALDRGADMIITSGGVSVGDFDLVKQVLAAEGAMAFWSLKMKPGRPLAFGVVDGVPLLGLPGNPVAAMISTELFARPALLKMQGYACWEHTMVQARLAEPITRSDDRRHHLRVRLCKASATQGYLEATLTGDQGSGILNSLVVADGLAIIPADAGPLPAGALVDVILLN